MNGGGAAAVVDEADGGNAAHRRKDLGCLRRLSITIDRFLRKTFYRLGYRVATHPVLVIGLAVLFAGLCALGLQKFTLEYRADKLWIPQDTEALNSRTNVDEYWTGSSFRFNRIIFTLPAETSSSSLGSRESLLKIADVLEVAEKYQERTAAEVAGKEFNEDGEYNVQQLPPESVLDIFYSPPAALNASANSTSSSVAAPAATVAGYFASVRSNLKVMTDTQITDRLRTGPYFSRIGARLNVQSILGGVSNDSSTGTFRITAFRYTIMLVNHPVFRNGNDEDRVADAWEDGWEASIRDYLSSSPSAASGLDVDILTQHTDDNVLTDAIQDDTPLISGGYMLLIVFQCVMLAGRFRSCSELRLSTGLAGIFSCALTLATTMGLCSAFGLWYGNVHQVLPLLLLGLNADLVFVIAATLDETQEEMYRTKLITEKKRNHAREQQQQQQQPPVQVAGAGGATIAVIGSTSFLQDELLDAAENDGFTASEPKTRNEEIAELMALTMSKAGSAVTVTTMTNMIGFGLGAVTPLPAVRYFNIWTFIGVFFLYVFANTFFAAILTLDTRRQAKGRYDVLCCLPRHHQSHAASSSPSPEEQDIVERAVTHGGAHFVDCDDNQKTIQRMNSSAAFSDDADIQAAVHKKYPLTLLARYYGKHYGPFIMRTPVRIAIITGFLVMAAINLYGATQLSQAFDISFFYVKGTSSYEFNRKRVEYFSTVGSDVGIYSIEIPLEREDIQRKMVKLATGGPEGLLVKSPEVVIASTIDSWYLSMRSYYGLSNDYSESMEVFPANATFYAKLNKFLNSSSGAPYQGYDLNLTDDGTGVRASRIHVAYVNYQGSPSSQVDQLEAIRDIISDSGLPSTFPYTFEDIFVEQYITLPHDAVIAVGVALFTVALVITVMIGHFMTSAVIFSSVALVVINLLGVVYWWDININSFSVTALIMAIGLSIDYSGLVGIAFMNQVGSKRARVIRGMQVMGPPLTFAITAIFLSISLLAFAKDYVFSVLFKMYLLILIFGFFHGTIYVPIMLSFFGPKEGFFATQSEIDSEEHQLQQMMKRSINASKMRRQQQGNSTSSLCCGLRRNKAHTTQQPIADEDGVFTPPHSSSLRRGGEDTAVFDTAAVGSKFDALDSTTTKTPS